MSQIDPDARFGRFASRRHGVCTDTEAADLGMTPGMLHTRVRKGLLNRKHSRVYIAPGAPATLEQRALAAATAARGFVSYRAAGALWRFEGIKAGEIVDVVVPHDRRPRVPGVRAHRTRIPLEGSTTLLGVIPITTPALTIVQLAKQIDPRYLAPALDDAIRRLTSVEKIQEQVALIDPRGRHGLKALIEMLDARLPGRAVPTNVFESLFFEGWRNFGGRPPECQYPVDVDGTLYLIDNAFPPEKVMVELDGYASHGNPLAFEEDRERQNDLAVAGWMPFRVTWRAFDSDPQRIYKTLSTFLRTRDPGVG